jgi:DNA-binding MarR family transcriptional regulator
MSGAGAGKAREVREVMDAFRRVVRELRLSGGQVERKLGISSAQLFVLHELGNSPGCSIGEVAERTHTDQSSVSTVVSRLVSAGLVKREASAEDGRRAELRLTTRGKALLRRAPGTAQERMVKALAGLPARERHVLARSLTQLVDEMGAVNGSAPRATRGAPKRTGARKKKKKNYAR